MKIIYNISGTYNSGGMERVLANKANYLVRIGYELTIVTSDQKALKPYFNLDPRIKQIDLGINYSDLSKAGLIQKSALYYIKQKIHKKRLTKVLREINADIVVSMFDHEVPFLWNIQDGSRKIVEIHFSRFKRLQYDRKGIWGIVDAYRSKEDLKWVRKYDRLIALTMEDSGYWGDLANMEVIPNANSFEIDKTADYDIKRVIAVGRYDYQKGFEDLIDSWSLVSRKFPDWRLDIFGSGELENDLQSQINNLNLTGIVQLKPPVKDIQKEYLNSSILAMSSRYEGLPMTLLEAQVCGLPMVAYACKCGPKDLITDGENGFLVEEGNKRQLAERLMQLMEDKSKRISMGQAAVKNSKNFTEAKVMQKWVDLFKELKG